MKSQTDHEKWVLGEILGKYRQAVGYRNWYGLTIGLL